MDEAQEDALATLALHHGLRLTTFLQEADKLLSALSLFTALTVFATNIVSGLFSYILSFLFLAITGVLFFELRSQFPYPLRLDWRWQSLQDRYSVLRSAPYKRLALFSVLLDLSFMTLLAYSIKQYLLIWAALAATGLLLFVSIVLIMLVRRAVITFPRLRRKIAQTRQRKPAIDLLFTMLPYLSISAAQLIGINVVEHYDLSGGFASAFRFTSYTATGLVVISAVLSWRTIPSEVRELIRARRKIAGLKREEKRLDAVLARQDAEIARLKAKVQALEALNGTFDQWEHAPQEEARHIEETMREMVDDFNERFPGEHLELPIARSK